MPDIDILKEVQRMQVESEKRIEKQLGETVSAIMSISNEGPVTLPGGSVDYGVVNEESFIQELTDRIEALEEQIIGYQLPISFRYRNDGASGTHQLEYVIKGTPYSSGTTEWPDADWTAISGADAETYEP